MPLRRFALLLVFISLLVRILPAQAQDGDGITDLIQMDVEAGFAGRFRPNYWIPLQIRVRNEDAGLSGKLIVRPETSGRVVTNAYSTPIDLPTGSDKVAFLYIKANDFSPQITIELLNEEGARVAQRAIGLNALNPEDNLYVTVADSGATSMVLTAAAPAGTESAQVNWQADDVPDNAAALLSVDTLILHDLSSTSLTTAQRDAIINWTATGGHLVVIGGPNWQSTAEDFTDILPLVPTNSATLEDLSAYGAYIGQFATDLNAQAIIATGDLREDARVLIETTAQMTANEEAGESKTHPLLVRWQHGAGTIDYLAADPTLEPLRSWDGTSEMWFNMLASPSPEPGWNRGFLNARPAAVSIAVLPGVELLPSVLSMIAFIVAYIFLIGPLNYFILSRLNRREWAWLSIPLFIVIFSMVAWTVGFNLRGNEIILSRLNVVQAWPHIEAARVDELIGVLSPRRDTYVMHVPQDRFLNVMPGLSSGGFLQQNITQSTSEIVQTDRFRVENISIDGGIFANFSTTGVMQSPEIGGSLTISYNSQGTQQFQGVLRNDSDITLQDAVVLARNRVYRVGTLASDDVQSFNNDDFTILYEGENVRTLASPLESLFEPLRNTERLVRTEVQTSQIILNNIDSSGRTLSTNIQAESEEQVRREAFLRSFMYDQYTAYPLGHDAYLIGWADSVTGSISIEGATTRTVDTSLYIIRLDVTIETPPPSQTVVVQPNQFSWVVREREMVEGGLDDLVIISGGSAVIRMMPLQEAQLATVETMTVDLDRASRLGSNVIFELWDWTNEEWVTLQGRGESYTIDDPMPFIGPHNFIDMRVTLSLPTVTTFRSSTAIRNIRITQEGHF